MFLSAAPRVFIRLSDGANLAHNLMSMERSIKILITISKASRSGQKKLHHKYKVSISSGVCPSLWFPAAPVQPKTTSLQSITDHRVAFRNM